MPSIPQNLQDSLNGLNDATNELATVMADLRSKISTSMSQADVDAVTATLTQVEGRLKGLAADPGNPVPPAAPIKVKP